MKRKKKLCHDERRAICKMVRLGYEIREIARQVDRAPSTISREIRRHCIKRGAEEDYFTQARNAQQQSEIRKSKASRSRIRLKNETIRVFVESKLKGGLSPELAAGRLTVEHPEQSISYEAIYQWLLTERADLRRYLKNAGKYRRRRIAGKKYRHKSKAAPPKRSIEDRPEVANKRAEIGHFEVDTIHGKKGTGTALLNATDRKTRLVLLNKVESLESSVVTDVLVQRLKQEVPAEHRKTLTFDNGPENALHDKIDAALGTESYFCHPYCSSEKGMVENRNRSTRGYFPKGTDFSDIPDEYIAHAEFLINSHPMKVLNFYTPYEVWARELPSDP